jgi:hypothetical protein
MGIAVAAATSRYESVRIAADRGSSLEWRVRCNPELSRRSRRHDELIVRGPRYRVPATPSMSARTDRPSPFDRVRRLDSMSSRRLGLGMMSLLG